MIRNSMVFGLGAMIALAMGWLAFPRVLYDRQQQPLEFRHRFHAEKSGTSQCGECHPINQDGAFAGIPRQEACATCHADRLGSSPAEARLVDGYIKKGREVAWLVEYRQPANVWFSHAIHTQRAKLACKECHGDYGETDRQVVYQQNRISGYSRRTMDMSTCEDCHHKRKVETGCLSCHQ